MLGEMGIHRLFGLDRAVAVDVKYGEMFDKLWPDGKGNGAHTQCMFAP